VQQSIRLMQGNEACAKGAIVAGCRFFAGYPITPSSEIAEELSRLLPKVGGKFIQMEDEIGAMAACLGASLGGLKVMTATSGPGFSLKQENLGFAAYTEIPCVVVNVMRGGPSTGLPTSPSQGDVMQARWGTHGDHPIIALAPASVREVYDLTIRAFNLSEHYRTPVILLYDEIIGHMREKVVLPDPSWFEIAGRKRPTCLPEAYLPYGEVEDDVPPLAAFGEGYRYHITGLAHDERGFPTSDPLVVEADQRRIHRKLERGREEILAFEEFLLEDARVAVLAYGITARSAKAGVARWASMPRRCGNSWPSWRRRHVEFVVAGARVLVHVADRHAQELRFAGGSGRAGAWPGSALGRSVRVPQPAWRSAQALVLGYRRSGHLVQEARRRMPPLIRLYRIRRTCP